MSGARSLVFCLRYDATASLVTATTWCGVGGMAWGGLGTVGGGVGCCCCGAGGQWRRGEGRRGGARTPLEERWRRRRGGGKWVDGTSLGAG